MNEIIARKEEIAPQPDSAWQRRLDALVRGECSEEDFMNELANSRLTGADSAWSVVALLDQRYRLGQMPLALFRSLESKISRRELAALDYGTTIEISPAGVPPVAPDESIPADTIEIDIEPPPRAGRTAAATTRSADAANSRFIAQPGRVLRGRYVLEGPLGSGGKGSVFRALDRYRGDLAPSNRVVAIKFLHETAAALPETLSNLRREFYRAQALSHPNIVKVHELDRDAQVEFFTMEFLEGEPLSRVIEKLDPLSMSRQRAWAIIGDVAAGLAHAHARGVVHADLKPRNIMMMKSGEIRILDFGASSAASPAYASCELLEGQRADPRDDLFALACISYELLAGQHPFQRRTATEARQLGLVARRPRGLTGRQWRVLSQGLAWRREERCLPVQDWIERLQPHAAAARRASTRKTALLAALAFGLGFSALFNRQLFEGKPAGVSSTMARLQTQQGAAVPAQPSAGPPPSSSPSPPPSPSPTSAAAVSSPPPSASPLAAQPQAPQSQAPQHGARSGAPAAVRAPETLSIAAANYRVGAHKNFAEIHVRRSNRAGADTHFSWWTEPSSALPGEDYVPQARTVQMLSSRSQMASLFVKLVPNVSRKHQAVFFVVIAEPGNGASLGRITRAAVVLPPQ